MLLGMVTLVKHADSKKAHTIFCPIRIVRVTVIFHHVICNYLCFHFLSATLNQLCRIFSPVNEIQDFDQYAAQEIAKKV